MIKKCDTIPVHFAPMTQRHNPRYRFFTFIAVLVACYAVPLYNLLRFALEESLFSYILIVPLISGYIAWERRAAAASAARGSFWPAFFPALSGFGFLAASWLVEDRVNVLSLQMLSFCCLFWSGGIFFLGFRKMWSVAFPGLFLFFMAPLPTVFVDGIESVLQYLSAETAFRFIKWSGIPVFRSAFFDFEMPGIAFRVAQECSGIRSSLVLFLVSLVAGNMMLRTVWARWVIALFVFPLGVVRNAFRILTLAVLCVHVDPSYIHSPLHTQGGPIFFMFSLIVFGAALFILRWIERSRRGNR
jgi:exosortase C (VPDSG-CTERM-specific)